MQFAWPPIISSSSSFSFPNFSEIVNDRLNGERDMMNFVIPTQHTHINYFFIQTILSSQNTFSSLFLTIITPSLSLLNH